MGEMTLFGIDMAKVVPGLVITEDELHALHEKVGNGMDYDFWVLSLRMYLQEETERLGHPEVIRQKDKALHVLYPPEASEYLYGLCEMHFYSAARQQARMTKVDIDKLTAEEKDRHDQRVFRMASQIMALDRARNALGMCKAAAVVIEQLRQNLELPSMK